MYLFKATVRYKEKASGSYCYESSFHVTLDEVDMRAALKKAIIHIEANAADFYKGQIISLVYVGVLV